MMDESPDTYHDARITQLLETEGSTMSASKLACRGAIAKSDTGSFTPLRV